MKGMAWESPRGPISIDPDTRDIIQNIYIRKVERKNGELYNVEFATFKGGQGPGQGGGEEVSSLSFRGSASRLEPGSMGPDRGQLGG